MSKERARRREERTAEAAVKAAARDRANQKAARGRARKAAWRARLGPLAPGGRPGQQTGILAARRRLRLNLIVTFLVLVQAVVWIVREDWQSSLAAFVVSALAFPVIAAFAL